MFTQFKRITSIELKIVHQQLPLFLSLMHRLGSSSTLICIFKTTHRPQRAFHVDPKRRALPPVLAAARADGGAHQRQLGSQSGRAEATGVAKLRVRWGRRPGGRNHAAAFGLVEEEGRVRREAALHERSNDDNKCRTQKKNMR